MMPGFVCRHVSAGAPVLRAVHDEPLDADDSGWSLTCGRDAHQTEDYLIVNLERYAASDESVRTVLASPVNTLAYRSRQDQPWVVEDVESVA